jgi:hypothetical protein
MSIHSVSRGGEDFRAAAGLARWSPDALDPVPEEEPVPRGPGLFEVGRVSGERMITNVRRLAGAERTPGSRLILSAAVLLGMLAAALYVVSLQAQYRYVLAVKHESAVSVIEAISLDAGMTVFALLALGLALAGQSARIERAAVVACALASAGMNYAAAAVASPRSVAAFVMPPLFLALVVDRVVAVVRRHVLGDAERSAWAGMGRLAVLLGMAALYALRFVLAPRSTAKGVRCLVLDAAPVPGVMAAEPAGAEVVPAPDLPAGVFFRAHGGITPHLTLDHAGQLVVCTGCPQDVHNDEEPPDFASKREAFEWRYRRHPQFGDRQAMSQVARLVGEAVGLQWGTSRTYASAILAADAISDAMDAAREEEAQ